MTPSALPRVRHHPLQGTTLGRCRLLLTLWALLPGALASAQSPGPPSSPGHPKIGLTLSGGAARALAHIGVLKVLEQAGVTVDVIAGTSMGSVVGGLYAAGYTATALDTIATTEDWYALLTDPVKRRDLPVERKFTENHYVLTLPIYRARIHLPRSVVAGQRISQLLARLTWPVHSVRDFSRLPIPFAAVATDLETGKAVVLDHGFLPDVIRASTAIPSVFSPVEIEGRVLIDGGVVRNLPAQDARARGADLLICSDVTDPLEPRDSIVSFVDVLVQSVSFRIWDSEDQQRRQCDVLIKPDVRAFPAFGFNRVRDIIARGEAAARAALPEIEALSRSSTGAREPRPPVATPDSVLVATLRFDDPGRIPQRLLVRALGLRPPTWVSRRELDQGIDRLYATGLFETVRYRLEALPGGAERRELTVMVREPSAGRFGVGLRYDSRYKASVLLSGILGGAGSGANGRVDVRLGQQSQVGLGVSPSVGELKTVTLGARADYAHTPFDLYDGEHRVAQVRVDLGALSASMAKHRADRGGQGRACAMEPGSVRGGFRLDRADVLQRRRRRGGRYLRPGSIPESRRGTQGPLRVGEPTRRQGWLLLAPLCRRPRVPAGLSHHLALGRRDRRSLGRRPSAALSVLSRWRQCLLRLSRPRHFFRGAQHSGAARAARPED
ncbi:MAG: hypothetical protein DMD36_04555 [Gemmatimonadetes bacterium]|nr:MAG: hypothetical protein DMD36_04555 [Gemmatimonadota bacterium]